MFGRSPGKQFHSEMSARRVILRFEVYFGVGDKNLRRIGLPKGILLDNENKAPYHRSFSYYDAMRFFKKIPLT